MPGRGYRKVMGAPPFEVLCDHARYDGAAWDRVCLDTPWGFSASDLRTETIVWTGDRDAVLGPAAFDYFRAAIADARAVVWEGDGHRTLAQGDRWGEVLAEITA